MCYETVYSEAKYILETEIQVRLYVKRFHFCSVYLFFHFSVPILILFLLMLYEFEGDKSDTITSDVDFTLAVGTG